MLENINKLIESAEGLTVSFKVGKESELVIKGDFMQMAKLVATLSKKQSEEMDRDAKIRSLETEISRLKS